MTPALNSPLADLVRGALADLSSAGILADFLEENGDPRGVLLRRRWKRWARDRAACEENARLADLQLSTDERQAQFSVRLYRMWVDFGVFGIQRHTMFVATCRSAIKMSGERFAAYIRRRFPEAAP